MAKSPHPKRKTAKPRSADATVKRRLPTLLRRSWFNLNQTFRRRIAHTGITPDQFTVLRTILEGDAAGMTQRELAETMSSDANTIASLLERMESAGFVERKLHEKDRRAYRLVLRPLGISKYSEVRPIAVELQNSVLSVLPAKKRQEFLENLEVISESCRTAAGQKNGG